MYKYKHTRRLGVQGVVVHSEVMGACLDVHVRRIAHVALSINIPNSAAIGLEMDNTYCERQQGNQNIEDKW